jgi:hypothetical protein
MCEPRLLPGRQRPCREGLVLTLDPVAGRRIADARRMRLAERCEHDQSHKVHHGGLPG